MKKTKQIIASLSLILLGMGTAQADYDLNLMQGVTKISQDVYDLHMLIFWICVAIGAIVFGVMFYSIYYHRKSMGHEAAQFHENTKVEIIWTIIPTVILISMAIPATKTMLEINDTSAADMTIKITGWQWKWEYDYLDEGINFFSNLDAQSNKARQLGSGIDPNTIPNYLLDVDEPMVIPVNTKIRFLLTAGDVIHSWWVPELGWKKDANPGFINEAWTYVEKPGIYRGQCAELCGQDHAFMPIVVIAMQQDDYNDWVEKQKAAALAERESANREWSQADLIAEGIKVYETNCASCHMENGEGVEELFPALTASPIVIASMQGELEMVMNGKGMMPAFAKMLSAADLAAVVTYTRNGLGNNIGDSVQPSHIQELLSSMPGD